MNLSKLQLNTTGKISKLNLSGNIRRRLLDLGIVKGTKITPIFKSPLNDPIAYEVRNSVIALRQEDSNLIDIDIER